MTKKMSFQSMSDFWVGGDERYRAEISVAPLITRVEFPYFLNTPCLLLKLCAQSKMAFPEDQGHVSVSSPARTSKQSLRFLA